MFPVIIYEYFYILLQEKLVLSIISQRFLFNYSWSDSIARSGLNMTNLRLYSFWDVYIRSAFLLMHSTAP